MRELLFIVVVFLSLRATGAPVISEFMASNETTLIDEDGDFPDWIEILNPDELAINLGGYFLTDDALRLNRWMFPATVLGPGERLLVFASGKDRDVGELHTDFRLSAGGEYLGLVAPDGVTVVSDFGERYPPQFEDESYGRGDFGIGYFDEPTPGAVNGSGRVPGPLFQEYRTGGVRPQPLDPVVVTARVLGVEDVTLFYRFGFGEELALAMTSVDGENFTATIPGGQPGVLIRWRFVGQDLDGRVTKEPPFADPEDSSEYHGVPVLNSQVESLARVMEWFIQPADYQRLRFFQRVRAGVYFEGEYYDNVRFSGRGQSTFFFDKKGFSINFNRTHRFKWKDGEARVKEIDLMTNWGDKAKVRNEMAYEILRESGVPTHFAETIRLQQNGQFFSLTDMVEDADETYLERAGLNPEATLYKADDTALRLSDIGRTGLVRLMAGEDEGLSDLYSLIQSLNQGEPEQWNYIFDHIDLPMTINTLAGLVTIMQTDMGAKNYYLYHDPEASDQWGILPWDLDLTFGRNFTDRAGYFDRDLFSEGYTEFAESQNTSVLVEALLRGNPRTRAMFFRRLRTLSDEFLASDYLLNRTQQQLDRLSPSSIFPADAIRDSFQWGFWRDGEIVPVLPWTTQDGDAETMERAVDRLTIEWLIPRRSEIFGNTPDLPDEQIAEVVRIGFFDFDPVSDDQDQEFLELSNQSSSATDVSGWRVDGGVRMTLPPGTVIPAGGSLFLSPNKAAFLQRDLSPRGGEQRFVLAPYLGNLSAEGETLDLYDEENVLRDSVTYSGNAPGFNGDSREDLDGDGLSAILEWGLGSSDLEYNGLAAPIDGSLRYRVRSNLNGFVIIPEVSEDLVEWSFEGVMETERLVGVDGFDDVTVTLPAGSGRLFVRLRMMRLQ